MLAKGLDIKRIKKHYKDIHDAHPGHIEKVVQALKDRNETLWHVQVLKDSCCTRRYTR